MKNILKTITIILTLTMLLAAACACGGGGNNGEAGTPGGSNTQGNPGQSSSSSSPAPTASSQDTPAPPTNDTTAAQEGKDSPVPPANSTEGPGPAAGVRTVEDGVLIMATNAEFPPYEFWEGSEIIGIDAEIAGAIAEKLGLTLRIDDIDFDAIIAAVSSGRVDMGMAGMTVTDERLQSVDFSTSYATGVQVIIVKEGSPITSVDDLFADGANYDIGVQESTTGDLYTTWDLEDEGLATIYRYKRGADAVQALNTGRVDCVVIDNEPAKAFVAMNNGLKILDTEYLTEDYAIAFAKGNTALRDAVDGALRELIADGTVQRVLDKYITSD